MAEKRLQNKNAVITGASHGIGRGIALAFAREGANLVFTYRNDSAAAQALVDQLTSGETRAAAAQIDGNDLGAIDVLLQLAESFLGTVDVLVNNVGVTTRTSFCDITPQEYDYVLTANLKFPFFLSQRVARHMIARKIRGSIINVSSVSAFKAVSKMAHYQCSKAGLSMLTKSLAYELAPYNIRVNTLSPGLTATQANRSQWEGDPELWKLRTKDIPLGRPGVPDDHGGAAVFLASDEASWMTGGDLVIDGGDSVI
jgi:NAD(P)-dependent dehydrogenase (short-subunit alcohol dehydrogenase family)